MNKRKAPIILSWTLLFFFAAGQFILYAHQHHFKYNLAVYHTHDSASSHQIILEKCAICDQMHHAPIGLQQILHYCWFQMPAIWIFEAAQHHYKGNSLVHADGLSPPAIV